MRCTFLLIVLARTTSTDYTATSFLFHTPEISIAQELARKEKALAETTALLVLREKFNALWETNEED
ncbi:hypothetical protein [Vibrio vulnificus]|uniref:hypothetical protein n=1 Tax=Vibrio vulnificus TaxID=672 RepID=UPI00165D5628|nr:hypothetical protein [Vibrio vulnificus]